MITTTTLDRDEGLKILTNAVDAIRTTIQKFGGEFTEKAAVSLLEFLHLHLIFIHIYKCLLHMLSFLFDKIILVPLLATVTIT